ncbi:dynamin family protein [Butyrivibrio fibrisolvens]|uniref:dynamin family protein n=1 Tax=Butyrivibrio fibrisolvens TaxID=831 RepID=UPI000406FF76|nr:dynamin family protein [Butyrivibrio fibrisolvens]
MSKIKIRSNPYTREIVYQSFDETLNQWIDVKQIDKKSRLCETDSERSFLPFKIKEIIDIIIRAYYVKGREKVELHFEGTQDEFAELAAVCEHPNVKDKIDLIRENLILENARFIKDDIKEIFEKVNPIIESIVKDDKSVIKGLNKVSQALDDVIPICVFGNYSAGKSTFINALIGAEILASGGEPVTARIYEIRKSTQPDRAQIIFDFHDERIELSIEGTTYRVVKGNVENTILVGIQKAIDESGAKDFYMLVRTVLNFIHSYEKKEGDEIEIGKVITLEVPYARNGVLGESANSFVIFDTPGSNSNSNADHSKVLAEAMAGFSNGIPIWVTQYESIDSDDNAILCDKVLAIEALDKRFTMIVVNRADGSDLEEGGFSDTHVNEILEYKAVEKMYASGIFFVSSIMGLGGKNNGQLIDKFYRRTYRALQEMYSEPEDEDYVSLYKYNIMPEQIKQNAIEYSEAASDKLIYANSGLYCIEKEIENFASKYSAYNKCQMVRAFLGTVIEKTNLRIDAKTNALKMAREKSSKELDSKTNELKESIAKFSKNKQDEYEFNSREEVRTYVNQKLLYGFDAQALANIDAQRRYQNFTENNFNKREKDYVESKDKFWEHLKESGQGLFNKNFIENAKKMVDDVTKDIKEIHESKSKMDETEKELDKLTSDEIMKYVINCYKVNLDDAQEKLDLYLDHYWGEKGLEFKTSLIREIAHSEALSDSQRDEITDMINNYAYVNFKDDAESVFVKKKFLKGALFGLRLGDSEKLNTNRLAASYNDRINKIIYSMSQEMNNNCFERFKIWKERLLGVIEANLTELNPELKSIAEIIRIESDSIAELENNQKTIQTSLEDIIELMTWKEI